jgi:hypothetical protein
MGLSTAETIEPAAHKMSVKKILMMRAEDGQRGSFPSKRFGALIS